MLSVLCFAGFKYVFLADVQIRETNVEKLENLLFLINLYSTPQDRQRIKHDLGDKNGQRTVL